MEYICDIGVSYDTIVRRSHVREKIVRCRNCEYGTQDIPSAMFNCSKLYARVSPNGFCAWAKQKQALKD